MRVLGDIAANTFTLDADFLNEFKDAQPDWGPVGYITYKRTYARKTDEGSEEWWQTLQRVVEGVFSIQKNHCDNQCLPWDSNRAQRTAQRMFQRMWDFKFLPPGRGLWSMGTHHIQKVGGMALNNCAFVSTADIENDPAKPFAFAMDCLMLGVGVGFDTEGESQVIVRDTDNSQQPFVIPDTREGWVDSVRSLLNYYLVDETHPCVFDYSKIRKTGSVIRGFGGVASGPEPLIGLHKSINKLFANRGNTNLTSTDIVDVMNMIGKCVVAGNVRRSAELAVGKAEDEAFSLLKQDKEALLSHRWASNNSVSSNVGDNYSRLAALTAANGEPGYLWLDNMREYGRMADGARNADPLVCGANPCVEQTLESYELCCLVETFPSRHDTLAEYMDTLKLAYLYAKTVTLVPTHWPEANTVMLRNRRIGCSQSGITRAFSRHGKRTVLNWCDDAYQYVCALDKQYSNWLCVPKSRKRTSVKPSGTVSLLPGETPGIHYPVSEYYIRRIRFASNSPWVARLVRAGYRVEADVTQPTNTVVVDFPVHEQYFTKSESDVGMWEQLENVAQYQHYWADNSVSATIKFTPEEAKQIPAALELYETRLKAISFLPLVEHGYEQAPYEAISNVVYDEMVAKVRPGVLFEEEVAEAGDGGKSHYCDGDKCEISPVA